MKKLLLALTLTTLTAFGQSSNLVQAIRLTYVDELGATNNTTINVDADEAAGFVLNYLKDVMLAQQQTNAMPTFQNSIRGTTRGLLLKPLSQQNSASEQKTNKVDLLFINGQALWDQKVFTAQQEADLKAIAKATNVVGALP
jgi:hypothetical protein